jgi:hypothetical protein
VGLIGFLGYSGGKGKKRGCGGHGNFGCEMLDTPPFFLYLSFSFLSRPNPGLSIRVKSNMVSLSWIGALPWRTKVKRKIK